MNWIAITEPSHLNNIVSDSFEHLVFVFKHSTRCSISKVVLSRFERNFKLTYGKPYLLDLLSFRDLSNQLAEYYGVIHESPQLLIIKEGRCVEHASHNAINTLTFNII